MAKTNELQFGVKNVKYALKDNSGVYGLPKDLAFAHEIALEPTFSTNRIYGDGRVIAEVVSDQGKTGTLIVVQIPHEYEKDMQQKRAMSDKSVADITQLDTIEHAIYYEVNKLENGVNQTIKAWLLNVTSGKPAETFTQSQAEPTLNNIEIPLTILGDYAKGATNEEIYVDVDGNKLRVTKLVSKPGDDNYATFQNSVPTPRISNILGVTGILTASNGNLTRTHKSVGTTVQRVTVGDYTMVKTTLDNTFPFSKIQDAHYLADASVKLPLIYKAFDGDSLMISDFKENDDFQPHPLFVMPDGSIAPYVFLNKYNFSDDGATLTSKSGVEARVNISLNQARTIARAKGMGYQMMDWKAIDYLQTLFRIKYATINSQSIFRGRVDTTTKGLTGATDHIPGSDGINNITNQFKFLGIEDIYGNIHELIDGVLFTASKTYIAYNPADYHSNAPDDKYIEFGPWPQTEGYVTKLHFNALHKGFEFPETLGGSSSTWYADYFWVNTEGVKTPIFGGSWVDASDAGLWRWYSGWNGTNASSGVGGRFLVNPFLGG